MELSKEHSLRILLNFEKEKAFSEKYKFTTKYKWNCLHCLKPIYVSYRQYNRSQIFCSECNTSSMEKTIVQYQYMRILKERQSLLINSLIKQK